MMEISSGDPPQLLINDLLPLPLNERIVDTPSNILVTANQPEMMEVSSGDPPPLPINDLPPLPISERTADTPPNILVSANQPEMMDGSSGDQPLICDPSTSRGRKQNREPSKWKRNIRKKGRNDGESYVTRKGKLVDAKTPKMFNCGSCRFKCSVHISDIHRARICQEYYGLPDYTSKNQFLCSLVSETNVRRRLSSNTPNEESRRKTSREYCLMTQDSIKVRVCQKFFCSTFAFSFKIVNTALKGKSTTGVFTKLDGRIGREPMNKIANDRVAHVKLHIDSFPRIEPHYCRKNTLKQYLSPELNIQSMYRLYRDDYCQRNGIPPVKEHKYREVFTTSYNLRCFIPKKDQCTTCNAYRGAPEHEKSEMKVEWDAHKDREQASQRGKETDKQTATQDTSFRAITFDLQAVLCTPRAGDAQIFYRRKLAVYNFTIFDGASHQGYNYIWDETEGGRGANEIGSALLDYLKSLPPEVNHVASFSDTCSGQNRNQFVCAAMIYAVQNFVTLHTIDLKFMESGHSYLEADSMHATIEKATKHLKIYTTREWELAIASARKKKPLFIVKRMFHSEVSDLKNLAASFLTNRNKNTDGLPVNWLRIKWLRFSKSSPYIIQYKYSLAEEFMKLNVASMRGRPKLIPQRLLPAYNARLPISIAKKADLMALMKDKVIPAEHEQFYLNLPSSDKSCDCLPCPDFREVDQDN